MALRRNLAALFHSSCFISRRSNTLIKWLLNITSPLSRKTVQCTDIVISKRVTVADRTRGTPSKIVFVSLFPLARMESRRRLCSITAALWRFFFITSFAFASAISTVKQGNTILVVQLIGAAISSSSNRHRRYFSKYSRRRPIVMSGQGVEIGAYRQITHITMQRYGTISDRLGAHVHNRERTSNERD